MSLFLWLAGLTLVVVGLFWQLTEIKGTTTDGAPREGMGSAAQPRRSSASDAAKRAPKAAWAEGLRANTASAIEQGLRRSDRLMLTIPVEVSGTNLEGKSFSERSPAERQPQGFLVGYRAGELAYYLPL